MRRAGLTKAKMPVAVSRVRAASAAPAAVQDTPQPPGKLRRRLAAIALSFMASCTPVPEDPPSRAVPLSTSLPPMKVFTAAAAQPPARPNAEIAQDFLDLAFRMESGRTLARISRFEGPILVRIAGPAPATLAADLQDLLGRLRREANIDIAFTTSDSANITVEAVPQAVLQRAVPRAACFVVPRIAGWQDFMLSRYSPQVDWTTLDTRTRAAIFVPADAAPQEIRDCLHEELAQAIGPLNDLYRLPDSVFNDDNIHTVLTGFDMLILRAYNAPELRSGLSRAEVAARLPSLLARLNPGGEIPGAAVQADTGRDWISAMETALTGSGSGGSRRAAAEDAIRIGNRLGWSGPRAGFAQYAYGRLQIGSDPDRARIAFDIAEAVYRQDPLTRIHLAHIAVQKAAFALAAGDAENTIALVDSAIPVAREHQNAALLATLLMFKAEALAMRGDSAQASAVRLDSLGWARYGFGSDANVQARLTEIAGLRPF